MELRESQFVHRRIETAIVFTHEIFITAKRDDAGQIGFGSGCFFSKSKEIVAAFLEKHKDFKLEPLELPSVFPKNETGMLALVPGEYDTDGFFFARLRRGV